MTTGRNSDKICNASAHALRMRRIIIIIITCICVQWVAMVFLVYREGMQLPLVAMVLREASALMRTSSNKKLLHTHAHGEASLISWYRSRCHDILTLGYFVAAANYPRILCCSK